MNVKKYLKKLWYKIVYLVIANVYIHSLGNLNEELWSKILVRRLNCWNIKITLL